MTTEEEHIKITIDTKGYGSINKEKTSIFSYFWDEDNKWTDLSSILFIIGSICFLCIIMFVFMILFVILIILL